MSKPNKYGKKVKGTFEYIIKFSTDMKNRHQRRAKAAEKKQK